MIRLHLRKTAQNVPLLSAHEINGLAERILSDYCGEVLRKPQPLNIENLLEKYLQLQMDYQYLSNDGHILGMTVFNDTNKVIIFLPEYQKAEYLHADRGTIIIDNNLLDPRQERRYRFTIGHECAHWILHNDYYAYNPDQLSLLDNSEPFVQCREINGCDLQANKRAWSQTRWLEWQADKLSAALLMPETILRRWVGNHPFSSFLDAHSCIKNLAAVFNVSEQAAFLRLHDLNLIRTPGTKSEYSQLSFL